MIKCSVCGQAKTDYNFFMFRHKYDKSFFANGLPRTNDVCWTCAGDYKCIHCGQVKDHTYFRVMGRICFECLESNPKIVFARA